MVTFFLEIILPILILLIVYLAVRTYVRIQYPPPLVLGCIIPKVCVVPSREILDFNKNRESEPSGRRLRREVRWKDFRVNFEYLREEACNTSLFQRALRFEKMKIDPGKPGLEYEPREILILQLLDEAAALRWKQARWQLIFLLRAKLRLSIDRNVCKTLLLDYKHLEDEFLALAEMTDDGSWRQMLVYSLGLTNWGMVNGGSEPEPA